MVINKYCSTIHFSTINNIKLSMTLYAKYLKTIGNPRFLPYIRVFLFVDVKFKQVALTEY